MTAVWLQHFRRIGSLPAVKRTGLNILVPLQCASFVVERCQVELQVKAVDHSRVPLWELKGGHVASGYQHGVINFPSELLENAELVGFRKILQTLNPHIRIENLHPYKIYSLSP